MGLRLYLSSKLKYYAEQIILGLISAVLAVLFFRLLSWTFPIRIHDSYQNLISLVSSLSVKATNHPFIVLFLFILVGLVVLPAMFVALKLIRRNRCLGRDIYRELAQADRFMNIWNAERPLLSDDSQYFWAFVPNGNRQAAHNSRIDEQLAQHNLIEVFEARDSAGEVQKYARPRRGIFLVRNSLVFSFLLYFRITFLGDRLSHIASGNGLINLPKLRVIYFETTLFFSLLCVFVLLAAIKIF
ncbi:MAG: hypothetical protein PHX93_01100 [Candidatus Peribacteraceae bacterium]|jgi:hypothetical protein|nr:hypothetical protein [Candidatus Peribacteraceae bacterium]